MKLASDIKALFPNVRIREQQCLSEYTTFRLGGSCPLFLDRPSAIELPPIIRLLHQAAIPFLIMGQGSNLVISDSGLKATVLRFCSDVPKITAVDHTVTVSGDTLLDDLALFTLEKNIGDLSFCTGIPGTVGGGIAGNAGAFGRQIGDHLISVQLLSSDGQTRTVAAHELKFSYRHSKLKTTGDIVLSAIFELPAVEKNVLQTERERIMELGVSPSLD